MIRPPCGSCSFICRYAACAHRNAPVRFTSTTVRQSSYDRSSTGTARGPNVPALLKSRSTRPIPLPYGGEQRGHVLGAGDVGGDGDHPGLLPGQFRGLGQGSRGGGPRAPPTSRRRSGRRATARPIPEPAPVTTAVFASEFNSLLLMAPQRTPPGSKVPGGRPVRVRRNHFLIIRRRFQRRRDRLTMIMFLRLRTSLSAYLRVRGTPAQFVPRGAIPPHSSSARRLRDATTTATRCAGPVDFHAYTASQGRDR